MTIDLVGELLDQLHANPERTLELVELLAPHLEKPAAATRDLTVSQAAARAGVSERTIRRSIDSGDLAAHKIRRVLRISPEALTEFIDARPARRGISGPRRRAPRPTTGSTVVADAFRMLDSTC